MSALKRDVWIARVLLVALVVATFGRIVTFGYLQWDDHLTIFENPALRPVTSASFASAWTSPQLSLWIPITHTLWALLAAAGAADDGLISPGPFRVVSLLLHGTATLLVFEIVRSILGTNARPWPALLAAIVFAVHPIQVEAVAWISGQKDLLAAVLGLAAIRVAIGATRQGVLRRSRAAAAILLGCLAMLAKPQAVTLTIVLPLALRASGATWRQACGIACGLGIASIPVAIVAKLSQPASLVEPIDVLARIGVALDALGFYARHLVWPWPVLVDYGRTPASVSGIGPAALGALSVLAVAVAAWRFRRTHPGVGVGMLIVAASVAPVLGLIPFEFQLYSTVSDHYLYPGMLGVALAVGSIASALSRRGVLATAALAAAALGAAAFVQVGHWRSTSALFEHVLAHRPESLAATRSLAAEAAREGDDARAIALLRVSTRVHPQDGVGWFNLGNALARAGLVDDACVALQNAAERRPTNAAIRHNLAIALIRAGDLPRAERELRAALDLNPDADASRQALERLLVIQRAMPAATQP